MEIEEIFFLNNYGGPAPMKVKDYLSIKLKNEETDPLVRESSMIKQSKLRQAALS